MKKLSALGLFISVYLITALPASAQLTGTICPTDPTADNVMNFNPLCDLVPGGNLITNLMNIAFIIVVLLALVFLIYGGIKWITSGGDKTKVEGARNMIVAALVGLVLAFLSYFIIQFIFEMFNLDFNSGNFWTAFQVF